MPKGRNEKKPEKSGKPLVKGFTKPGVSRNVRSISQLNILIFCSAKPKTDFKVALPGISLSQTSNLFRKKSR